ncbi:MAG: hypothetical protein JOZ54_21470 [Acidobacteria bacterium]|nr:hypothetical protein [Acidobacteriota bacterium]
MRKLLILIVMSAPSLLAATLGPATPVTAASPNGTHYAPSIALTANGMALIWRDNATHAGSTTSTSINTALNVDPTPYRDATIATIGDESYPVWIEDDWIYGFVLGSNGQPRTDRRLLAMVDSRHTQRIAVAAAADRYIMVWPVWTKLLAILIDRDGNILQGDTPLTLGGGQTRAVDKVAVAPSPDGFLVVWDESSDLPWESPCGVICPSGDRTVRAIKVGLDGQPKPETEMELATNAGMPDVVWNGTDFLAVWANLPHGGVSGRHISANGATAGETINFSTGPDFGPKVVWDGSAYDMAYISNDGSALFGIRSSANGSQISPLFDGPIGHPSSARGYSLSAHGSAVALAYENDGRIFLRRVSTEQMPGRVRAIRR